MVAGLGDAGPLAERLDAMEQRMAAAETGVARAEADRAGWKKVRDQLQAALARVEGRGAVPGEKVTAAVRTEVGARFAELEKRLGGVEAAQATLREELSKLRVSDPPAKAEDLMMVGKAVGKLATRVAVVERDLKSFATGLADEGESDAG